MDLRYTFDSDSMNYDLIRPDYPNQLYVDIADYSGVNSLSDCLEIGCATGQATKPLLDKGMNVTSIDIGKNLCSYIAEKFREYDNFNVINADFMDYQFKEERFELVFSATAFHWLPDEAYRKVKTLLKQNGTFVLFWNRPYPNRLDDESNLINREVYRKYRPGSICPEEFEEKDLEKIIIKLDEYGFGNIETKIYHRVRRLSSTDYIKLLNTYSDHIALPREIKERFEDDMKEKLDSIGGYINIYDTIDMYLAKR